MCNVVGPGCDAMDMGDISDDGVESLQETVNGTDITVLPHEE